SRDLFVRVVDANCTRMVPWSITGIPPVALCKNAIAVINGNSAQIMPDNVNNGSTSGCVMQTLSVSPNLFNCSNVGVSQTVILTVSDRNGSNSCTASITVGDNTAPEITCPANFTVNTESGQCSAV